MENVIKQVDAAFIYIIAFSLALLLGVTAAMVYFIFRYRRDRHPEAADIRGNVPLEAAWTLLPTFIALSMFYFGWQSYLGLREVPRGALEVDVTSMKFSWVFKYPNGKRSERLMLVPLGRPVKVNLTSLDVIHSFYVPAYRVKMDALKGMKTYAWFLPSKLGTHKILCAEYCGAGHADMMADLRVVPESEYQAWVEKK